MAGSSGRPPSPASDSGVVLSGGANAIAGSGNLQNTFASSNDLGCFSSDRATGSRSSARLGFPPISAFLDTEIAHTQEELQSQEYVRYGDSIKLFATSQYRKNEERAKNQNLVGSQLGGYIGVYEKPDGTARVAVPPIGDAAEGTFKECVLRVTDPHSQIEDGEAVRYGATVCLVDEAGLVWNNKIGTGSFAGFFEGYLGPKPRGSNGELYVSFQKNGADGRPLIYGENAVYIDVEASHRVRSGYNSRLTNYKSSNSRVHGGYVCSDGTGMPLPFCVHRHTGPPVQAYNAPSSPVAQEGGTAAPRPNHLARSGSSGGSVFAAPKINFVAIRRHRHAGEYLDVMIKEPLYGKPIKLYDLTPEDDIVVSIGEDHYLAETYARHLFDAVENAAATATGAGTVGTLQINIAVKQTPSEAPRDATKQQQQQQQQHRADAHNSTKVIKLASIELLVEQDLDVLNRAFKEDQNAAVSSAFFDGDLDDTRRSTQLGKLDLLIASHKLAMVYFAFAVVIPYCLWQIVLVVGDLIEPVHHLAESNSSLALVERLATSLVRCFGIPVENGRALITDAHRDMDTTTTTTAFFAFYVSYALGFITPDFARFGTLSREAASAPTQHSSGAAGHDPAKGSEESSNWLIAIQVPEEALNEAYLMRRASASTVHLDEDTDTEGSGPRADTPAHDARRQSVPTINCEWAKAGVDDAGVPLHPAFPRFLAGEKGNLTNAKARWLRTCEWRAEGRIDEILLQPHPYFHVIRKNQPSNYYGRGKHGHPVYIDRPGGVNLKALKKAGVKLSDLLFHFMYSTEFLWTQLEPSEKARTISILDVNGIGLWDFRGEVIDFVRKTISLSGEHYPERAHKIFIINVPRIFNTIWAVIKPMLDEATRDKVGLFRTGYKEALLKEIDADQLPECYGGSCPVPLGESLEDRMLNSHVCKILIEKGIPMKDDDGKDIPGTPESLAKYVDDSLPYGVSKFPEQ